MKITIALVIGQAIGLRSLKNIIPKKNIIIKFVIGSDSRYYSILEKICSKNKIKFFKADSIKKVNKYFKKEQFRSDYLISIFSNLILKKNFLVNFKGCFNIHPGILPQYAGINPISGMIFNGEKKIGVTLHKMTRKVDGGQIIFLKKKSINHKDNLITCTEKIQKLTKKILEKFLRKLINNQKLQTYKNDISKKKFFPKKIPNNGLLNFNWTLKDFIKHFNAGFSGPFKSSWGKIFFIYKRRKKIIYNFKSIRKKHKIKIFQINQNTFDIKLKNKTIKVNIE